MTARRDDGWRGLRRVFRLPASGRRLRGEVSDELRFHLEGRIEDLMAREGLSRSDAEREARRRFGDLESYQSETSSIDLDMHKRRNRMELFDAIRRETRQALRTLRRAPSFSIIAFVTLALGLAASTTIFTLLDRIVLRPLPYRDADRLIYIGTLWPGMHPPAEYRISRFMYFRFREAKTLEKIGIYTDNTYALPGSDGFEAERVSGTLVSASLFDALDIRPEAGTLFSATDELPQQSDVILITHSLWTRRFGSDPGIVGRMVDLGGFSKRVIGVLPASARLPDGRPEIWAPLHLSPTERPANNHVFSGVARLAPGADLVRALAEVRTITARMIVDQPGTYPPRFLTQTGFAVFARSLQDEVIGPRVRKALWIAFAAVGLVLLVAAANVANLFLVRIEARRREVAVRTALGADRAHLAANFLSESLILAGAAAVGAILLAFPLLRLVVAFAPADLPRLAEVSLDWRSAAFSVTAAIVVGVVFGLVPLTQKPLDLLVLREGGRGLGGSRGRNTARRVLAAAQVSLAVVLLVAAGLMLKSFQKLRAVQPGFDATGVVSMRLLLSGDRYGEAQQVAFWHELYRRVAALPSVSSVGATEAIPMNMGDGCTAVYAPESTLDPDKRGVCIQTITVAPGYFATMRIGVRGHDPDWSDNEQGTGAIVVSRSLAERLWPGQDPIGKTLVYSVRRKLDFHVTGIADDVRGLGLMKAPIDAAYFPMTAPATAGPSRFPDMGGAYLALMVRSTASDVQPLVAGIRRAIGELDRRVPAYDVETMERVVAHSNAQTSFTMLLLGLSALIALVLSAVGMYGAISYIVSQRRSEIGIRMALGARGGQVSRMVVAQSLGLAIVGAAVGVGAALLTTRLLRAFLFEVTPTDPVVLLAAPAVLLAVAALASFEPAHRASRVDPAIALRAE